MLINLYRIPTWNYLKLHKLANKLEIYVKQNSLVNSIQKYQQLIHKLIQKYQQLIPKLNLYSKVPTTNSIQTKFIGEFKQKDEQLNLYIANYIAVSKTN